MLDNWCARSASLLPGTVQDVFQAHVRGTSGGNRIDLLTFWKGTPQTVRTPPMALLHCASTVPGTPCRYLCPSPACTPFPPGGGVSIPPCPTSLCIQYLECCHLAPPIPSQGRSLPLGLSADVSERYRRVSNVRDGPVSLLAPQGSQGGF